MADNRKFWETKMFWGMAAFAGCLLAESFLGLDCGPLKAMSLVWMGWSAADRLRK